MKIRTSCAPRLIATAFFRAYLTSTWYNPARKKREPLTKEILLAFPDQLSGKSPLEASRANRALTEHPLFFTQYPCHPKKIIFHRASMKVLAGDWQKEAGRLLDYDAVRFPSLDTVMQDLVGLGYNTFHQLFELHPQNESLQTGPVAEGLGWSYLALCGKTLEFLHKTSSSWYDGRSRGKDDAREACWVSESCGPFSPERIPQRCVNQTTNRS